MSQIKLIVFCFFTLLAVSTFGQIKTKQSVKKQRELNDFPKFIYSEIPGSPKLSAPRLISGTELPVISEGYGWSAPAFYDWDGDGLKDLLVGEFGSGIDHGQYVGNFVRVYKNIGTEEGPQFTGKFSYARSNSPRTVSTNGTPYSVDQFCCMGFTPQFVDINNDGKEDLISGTYWGEVWWFPGSQNGIMPGSVLPQHGNPKEPDLKKYIANQGYWLYSTVSFGDLTGDGLADLIVGGRSLRISRNIGTAEAPVFDKRRMLLDVDGKPLKVFDLKEAANKEDDILGEITGGDHQLRPLITDWDEDGVNDLLVTTSYEHDGLDVVYFFKGVRRHTTIQFQQGIPLFKSFNGGKAFPGSSPVVNVCDWNNDGVKDLLIGVSAVTVKNEYNDLYTWTYERKMGLKGIGKDPFNFSNLPKQALNDYLATVSLPNGIKKEDYLTIKHRGYVFVMLGIKE